MAEIQENVRIRLPGGEWFFNPKRPLGPPGGFGEVFEGGDAKGQRVAVKRLKLTVGRERRKNADRQAVIKAGEGVFRELVAELKNLTQKNLFEARIHSKYEGELRVSIGQADLLINLEGAVPPNVFFRNGTWQVMAVGSIQVSQKEPPWSHGATLWYIGARTRCGVPLV